MNGLYKNKLAEARFRGVKFNVREDECTAGRRAVTHTYPHYDTPFTEDMGKKPRSFSMQAFVVGPDYVKEANALIEACEKSTAGSLDHPWLGKFQVICTDCRVRFSMSGLGEAVFTLAFQEEGYHYYPGVIKGGLVEQLRKDAQKAIESFKKLFLELFKEVGPGKLKDLVTKTITEAVDNISNVLNKVGCKETLGDYSGVLNELKAGVTEPEKVAEILDRSIEELVDAADPRIAVEAAMELAGFEPETMPITESLSAGVALNQSAITNLVKRLAVVTGVRAALSMEYKVYQNAVSVRNRLVDALDNLMLEASEPLIDGSFDHRNIEVVEALRGLQTGVAEAFDEMSASLARLVVKPAPKSAVPSLVLAYRLYNDLEREAEILAFNPHAAHPGFLPGGESLEVLDA